MRSHSGARTVVEMLRAMMSRRKSGSRSEAPPDPIGIGAAGSRSGLEPLLDAFVEEPSRGALARDEDERNAESLDFSIARLIVEEEHLRERNAGLLMQLLKVFDLRARVAAPQNRQVTLTHISSWSNTLIALEVSFSPPGVGMRSSCNIWRATGGACVREHAAIVTSVRLLSSQRIDGTSR